MSAAIVPIAPFVAHAAAEKFPLMGGADLDALAKDIAEHGLSEPIILCCGKILDGRARAAACAVARVEPRFEEFTGADPEAFVLSANLHRRHLDQATRRALVRETLLADPARSSRAVAAELGVHHAAVSAQRAELETTGEIIQMDATVGRDGRTRRVRRPAAREPNLVWEALRTGLVALASISLLELEDAVAAASLADPAFVDEKLTKTFLFLETFERAWENRPRVIALHSADQEAPR